jgi:hypothetical protein
MISGTIKIINPLEPDKIPRLDVYSVKVKAEGNNIF